MTRPVAGASDGIGAVTPRELTATDALPSDPPTVPTHAGATS